jgi:phosphoglycolate phosphatase-like HAD superfamily hydrolase
MLGLVFDFDQTLAPETMTDPILRSWGLEPEEFWASCIRLQQGDDAFDMELSYLYRLVEEGRKDEKRRLDSEKLFQWGQKVKLYPGLVDEPGQPGLFKELEKALGPGTFQAFIVSGGLTPMVWGCFKKNKLDKYFQAVFACRMAEEDPRDKKGRRLAFPKEVVGFTMKTQKLFAISKGSWQENSTVHVNDRVGSQAYRIPFSDMLYLGDGHSDIAAFATLKKFGGTCFAVHQPGSEKGRARAKKISKEDERTHAYFEADYRQGGPLRAAIMQWARSRSGAGKGEQGRLF